MPRKPQLSYSLLWNCSLIIIGSIIQGVGFKTIGEPHQFVPGGLFGISSLIYYLSDSLNPALYYMLFNIPMFVFGYLCISKRFLGYSFLAMLCISGTAMSVDFTIPIQNQLYAALSFGVFIGAGAGMVLRSLGSNGGLDVVAIYLNQKFNIGIGKFYFAFNCVLFSFSFATLDNDLVIASMISVFITSVTVDYCLSMFNQRKLAFIISEKPQEIANRTMEHLKIGTTMLPATGAYRNTPKTVLMVVINNIQLKRLEEIVFTTDPVSLFIVENTFSVLGSTFSKRKIY
ncbi:MAG: YitT family protein [Desulfuromonas sp.]|nr:MAG: YitT family protein [Desulfuromonas sp.]